MTLVIIATLTASLFGLTSAGKLVKAVSGDPWLEVEPNQYITNKLETFDVEVWLNNITADKRLIGVQFSLRYNSTLLQVQNVVEGSFLKQFNQSSTPPYTLFVGVWNDTHVDVVILIIANPDPLEPPFTIFPEGNGPLATITFKGIYPPDELYVTYSCALELEGIILLNDSLSEIPYLSPVNGYYEITKTLLGDVDGDGDVDIFDIAAAAWAFGAYGPDGPDYNYPGVPAHPRWLPWGPLADINNDNKVDIRDITIIGKNFGKTFD